ncbi:MAG: response regulator [Patescibacteria group bacterium]
MSTDTKKRLLIIEDDQDLRELYVEVLRDEGFEVAEAADGQVGLEKAKAGNYDLLLLDIMLPKIDGLQILKAVKESSDLSKIPVVMLTNLGRESIIKEGFTLGADGYIIKSEYTPDQVVAEVRKFLEGGK